MDEFENSFGGLKKIIIERKLYKKKPYYISGILILLINAIFYFSKSYFTNIEYFNILKVFVSTFLPAFITFCGFTMTAYSLVVGFLNYGVFKSTIEEWYRMKIEIDKGLSNRELPKFSLYQNGIALFALAILTLLFSVIVFLIIKFVIDLNLESESNHIEIFNAFILLITTLISNFSLILMVYNIVNIFTFSQSLNKLVYFEELEKSKKEEELKSGL